MDRFWDAFQNSTILQAVITVILVVTVCALVYAGRPIPELLGSLTTLVFGFWFGSKSQQRAEKVITAAAAVVQAAQKGDG